MTVVRATDSIVKHFCSSKCRKNFEMGRDNKKVDWVRKFKQTEVDKVEQLKKEEMERTIEKQAKDDAARIDIGKKVGGK